MKKAENARRNTSLVARVAAEFTRRNLESAYPQAEWLVRHFARMDRAQFFSGERSVTALEARRIDRAVKARLSGRPLQYVLKRAPFRGRDFFVGPTVLIPRPETELLVERSLEVLAGRARSSVLDVGTGSGCIAVSLTIEKPDCRMTAVDVSKQALAVARKNSAYHELGKKIRFLQSDLFSAVRGRRFDLIVTNPPYIPGDEMDLLPADVRREPTLALNGGVEGLEIIRRVLSAAPSHLSAGGTLLMEIGLGQSSAIDAILSRDARYASHRFWKDLSGIHRIMEAKVNG